MRTRTEIESSYKEVIVPAGTEAFYKLTFEILLDIRELLKGMREQSLYEIVSDARQEEEARRRDKIRENIK